MEIPYIAIHEFLNSNEPMAVANFGTERKFYFHSDEIAPFQNASPFENDQRIDVKRETGELISKKSIPAFCEQPAITSRPL